MIALHYIKHGGVLYSPGMEVPVQGEETPSPSAAPETVEEPKPHSEEPNTTDATDAIKAKYSITSKSDIAVMRKDQLVKIAGDLGMNGAEYLTVAVLKERIQAKLGF